MSNEKIFTSDNVIEIAAKLADLVSANQNKPYNYTLLMENDHCTIMRTDEKLPRSRVILVDPKSETITETYINMQDNSEICYFLGVRVMDIILIDSKNALFVDDEGRLVDDNKNFWLKGGSFSIAGTAIISGIDDNGESTDTLFSLDDVKGLVSFQETNMFRKYLVEYLEEMGIDLEHSISYDEDSNYVITSLHAIIDAMSSSTDAETEAKIKWELAAIKKRDLDPLPFFEFIGKFFFLNPLLNQEPDGEPQSNSPKP